VKLIVVVVDDEGSVQGRGRGGGGLGRGGRGGGDAACVSSPKSIHCGSSIAAGGELCAVRMAARAQSSDTQPTHSVYEATSHVRSQKSGQSDGLGAGGCGVKFGGGKGRGA
jgi:hypothetical protein